MIPLGFSMVPASPNSANIKNEILTFRCSPGVRLPVVHPPSFNNGPVPLAILDHHGPVTLVFVQRYGGPLEREADIISSGAGLSSNWSIVQYYAKFISKYDIFHKRKCIWKCHLQNGWRPDDADDDHSKWRSRSKNLSRYFISSLDLRFLAAAPCQWCEQGPPSLPCNKPER